MSYIYIYTHAKYRYIHIHIHVCIIYFIDIYTYIYIPLTRYASPAVNGERRPHVWRRPSKDPRATSRACCARGGSPKPSHSGGTGTAGVFAWFIGVRIVRKSDSNIEYGDSDSDQW